MVTNGRHVTAIKDNLCQGLSVRKIGVMQMLQSQYNTAGSNQYKTNRKQEQSICEMKIPYETSSQSPRSEATP